MVAPNKVNDSSDLATEENVLSPKQQKRMEEQNAREAKKLAKRQAQSDQRERRSAEKENREESMERKKEAARLEKQILTPLEMEEAKRLEEEQAMLEQEFGGESTKVVSQHTKKSSLESNRLGGSHMA